ncbi:hypothetical protein MN116_000787 [Schistosoma mekongi]|uniref:C2H2-type domain-containing protein n=1 Tax=Schistosoma mekongi TaxID=38744 RepID=A0AAE2D8T5_SCHME|nr:hypothetical protein MN116_000787 [Schistosoma mekongi]
MNSMNNSINNHEYNHIQYESNTSSNITSNSINNYSQTENWINPITLNKQLTGYKETSNIMHNKDTQEKFSYQLARSFLDYFYGKLTNSINSESNNYPSTLCHPHTVTTNNTINTNINNNNNNNTVYKEDHNESINPLYMNNDRRTLEWLTNINLINQQQINEQSNLINHHQPTLTSSNTFPCLLCGQIFNGHTELCMHVYTHLLAFSIQETKKSNHMEEALRYLHSDTSQIRNNRPNSLLNENKNDSSFTPFVLPPPLPPSIMTTNIPTVTTASSVNYNPLQSFSIAESNHSFNSSDSIYLFQSYLSQWLRNFSSPNSNHQLQHEMINPSSLPNSSWISSDASTINKSMDYKTWQNILTTAYLYSMKESTSIASSGTIPSSTINSNSIPLQNSLQRNENSNYYDIFFGSKPFITPFPQS